MLAIENLVDMKVLIMGMLSYVTTEMQFTIHSCQNQFQYL